MERSLRQLSARCGAKKRFPSTSLAEHDLVEDPEQVIWDLIYSIYLPAKIMQPSNSVDALIHLMNKVACVDDLRARDKGGGELKATKSLESRHHIAHGSHALLYTLAEVIRVQSQDSSFLVQTSQIYSSSI